MSMQLFEFRCKNQNGKWEIKSEYLEDYDRAQSRARELLFDYQFSTIKIRTPEQSLAKKPKFNQ